MGTRFINGSAQLKEDLWTRQSPINSFTPNQVKIFLIKTA